MGAELGRPPGTVAGFVGWRGLAGPRGPGGAGGTERASLPHKSARTTAHLLGLLRKSRF